MIYPHICPYLSHTPCTCSPTATISWSKDGQQLTISGRISTTQSGRVLNISGVLPSDTGTYSCDTSQPASQGTYSISAVGSLTVIGELS